MRLTDMLALSHVPRWAIVPHLVNQTVGDHTFRTLVIAVEIAERCNITLSTEGILNILYHDATESRTGDIPAPAKDSLPGHDSVCPWYEPFGVSPLEDTLLKVADLIEAYTWIERYGVGEHARKAAQGVHAKLRAVCPEEWRHHVFGVIDLIAFDSGR